MNDTETAMLERWAQERGAPPQMSEPDLLADAERRIEQHRKADALIRVLDPSGRPVPNARVQAYQTRHSFLFGCNVFPLLTYSDPELEATYERQFAALFNYATLGFYWGAYERRQGQTIADHLQAQARWCRERGIETKGHPLIWHEVYPEWGPSDPQETRDTLRARVTDIVSAFAGLVDCWDVVNEATVSADFDNGVGHWAQRDGPLALVTEALDWARAANPDAVLLYNDFNIWPPDCAFEQFAARLVQAGPPLDVLGIQSHWHEREHPLPWVWELCETYRQFGKPLHFTELTVVSGEHGWMRPTPWPTTPDGEARQADYVEKLYALLFSHPAIEAITWWDFMDEAWQGAPAGLVRADLSPKPIYERLLARIKGDWWTRADLHTDADGLARFRGFLGRYRITATGPAGAVTQESELSRDGDNSLTLVPA